jgi:pilus assembly protein CpaF
VECVAEFVCLGVIEEFLADDNVTEIMCNGPDMIYIERKGTPVLSDRKFLSSASLRRIIERIVATKNRRIDESVPYVDTRLDDGSRVHAIIPPLALDGPTLTIRKFPKKHLGPDDLVRFGAVTPQVVKFLEMAVTYKQNVIVSGGTGSGKTTLLNTLSRFIPERERVITVEDSAELRLQQPHVVRLEGRPANIEGKGEVTIRDLVRNCLRMRPDRIIVGECRGKEAFDMLQAMNTGHEGSMTTVHANNTRDAVARIESMCLMAGLDLPISVVRQQISSAVNFIIQQSRLADGSRKLMMVSELTGMEAGGILMQPIFEFKQTGFDAQKKITGYFTATGMVPKFVEHLREMGTPVSMDIFQPAPQSGKR